MKKKQAISTVVLILIGLILLFELIRDSTRDGDFIGYIRTGNLVLAHKDIYTEWLNTWPPFFSILCALLSLVDKGSSILIRLLWLVGTLVSMYWVINLTLEMIFNKPLTLRKKTEGINLTDDMVIIPLLIMLRFLLENLANLQINVFMLLLASLTIYYFIHNKYYLAGLLLALSVSMKVYTIFLLFYFIYKREWKIVASTFLFLVLLNSLTFLVFGFNSAIDNYTHWYKVIASNPPSSIHLNQSVFGLISRLITANDPENNFYINFFSLKHPVDTYIKYGVILLASIYPLLLFRKKISQKDGAKAMLEYAIVFSIIPLFSTLAWKAYFIFLWLPYLLTYIYLFRTVSTIEIKKQKSLKLLFLFSIVTNVFTSDGIIGKHASDILQSFSCITFGTISLIVVQLIIYRNIDRFGSPVLLATEGMR